MKPKRTALALAVGLAFGLNATSVQADENADAAERALEICLATFPDSRAAKAQLKADDWRFEGVESGMNIYSQNGYRAVAATAAGQSASPRCFVSSSKMSQQTALALGKRAAKALDGAKQADQKGQGVLAQWEGSLNGTAVKVGVLANVEFGVMRGAGLAIMAP